MDSFPDRDALAEAAAAVLAHALAGGGPRSLVATGGGTPGAVYDRLSAMDLQWGGVTVTLSDERFVGPLAAESNARLVRERLLTGQAAAAAFLPLKGDGATPEADALAVEPALRALTPWSAVLLGMGEDGHVASLFPRDPELASRTDPAGGRLCVGVEMAGLEPLVPRISLTLAALTRSPLVVILVTGAGKRAVIERIAAEPGYAPPAAALLRQTRAPVRVMWAP
jgi:6-phosphogluconolactonase